MGHQKKSIAEHKTLALVLTSGLIVLMNCCGFPIYNFGKHWPLFITIEKFLMPVLFCGCMGSSLALLFPQRGYAFILSLLLSLTGIGVACHFLLEYGEVSNTYNFTPPNILFHVLLICAVGFLGWLHVRKS